MTGYAEAAIEGDCIVIRVPIAHMENGIRASDYVWNEDPDEVGGDFRITDAQAFAKEFVRALNDEDEDGTTDILRLLDRAAEKAIEGGAEGCSWPKVGLP